MESSREEKTVGAKFGRLPGKNFVQQLRQRRLMAIGDESNAGCWKTFLQRWRHGWQIVKKCEPKSTGRWIKSRLLNWKNCLQGRRHRSQVAIGHELKSAGAWTKFRLLTWKNFLQQWRHRWQTLLEMLLPVVTMSVVLLLRWQIPPEIFGTTQYPYIEANSLNHSTNVLSGMKLNVTKLAYSPRSDVLESVLRNALATLFQHNIKDAVQSNPSEISELLPEGFDVPIDFIESSELRVALQSRVKIDAYNSSSELSNVYNEETAIRSVIAAVEFDDSLKGNSECQNLNDPRIQWFIRVAAKFNKPVPKASSLLPKDAAIFHSANILPSGYIFEMFIALQHVISMELISRVTDFDLREFPVSVRRYPHPPFVKDIVLEALTYIFPLLIILAFCYTAVNIIRAVTLEKELQLKETMKVMGLPTWLHWTAWFCKQFVYMVLSTILILILLKVNWFSTKDGFKDYAVFTNTPPTVLLFYLWLYIACMIFFCFMISGFFSKGATAALFGGVVWFLTYVFAILLSMDAQLSPVWQAVTCLSINSAMTYGFQLLLAAESTGGMQWGQFFESPSTENPRFLFGHVVIMLTLNCCIYMMIALYLEQVIPGPSGTPQPWYFLVRKRFWCSSSTREEHVLVTNDEDTTNIIKESDPINHNIGLKISRLTKVYGTRVVVDNLSLNIYDDQITVLLGHNGAGKSTTISMLTGNLKMTSGSVTVAGYDMASQGPAARSHIGLCPQHDVVFNELTVHEHLEFFARLKGLTGQHLAAEIDSLIEKLELQEKRNYMAKGLSGGQKRRLCVGIALCGGARVVLLDEPTSGMDPASRRALWDLLQKEKRGRSMILTTHFMDEADILGDRVAIMALGRLQCIGSPFFLKRHYGVGYTLVVVKDAEFDSEACTRLIDRYIPGTTIKEDRGSEVTYVIANEYSHIFEAMLTDLESNKETIKFKAYGLDATTLEDVFMSVGADVSQQKDSDPSTSSSTEQSNNYASNLIFETSLVNLSKGGRKEGFPLMWQHALAIWMKLWLMWTRSWQLLLLQLAVPVLLMTATLGVMRLSINIEETIQSRPLTLRKGFKSTETFLNFNGSDLSSIGAFATAAYQTMFSSAKTPSMSLTTVTDISLDDYYLKRVPMFTCFTDSASDSLKMTEMRHQVYIGATFSDDSATAWFSNFGYHDVSISLATVHEALLRALNPDARLTVYNHPLRVKYKDQHNIQAEVITQSTHLTSGIGSSLGIISAVFIMFYIKERITRAKLLQKAAGINAATMWFGAAVFDWTWFLLVGAFIPMACAAFEVVGLKTVVEICYLYICMMLYAAAMLPIVYVLSYCFNTPELGFVVNFFMNLLFGFLGEQVVATLRQLRQTKLLSDVMDKILQMFPLYSFLSSVRIQNDVGRKKWMCQHFCNYMISSGVNIYECTMKILCTKLGTQCCVPENAFWRWHKPGVMRYLLCMMVTGLVMWVVFMLLEFRVHRKIFNRENCPPPIEDTLDEDVVEEANYARQIGTSPPAKISLVALGLSKYYKKYLAVDQLSFTVGRHECFGLLGVNGAGKTTTFKMLMGDEKISSGDAYICRHSVKTQITKVYEKIGYCPQFDAVFGEMTGRENLRFFSKLRGIHPENAAAIIEALAHMLGFFQHIDKRADRYSGGNRRKLSTAVALMGRTRLIFVDEPTTGVDPAAKRQVWSAIRGAQRAGRGIVLTSHSMEECEALCSRLTIMVNGRFQCMGTPQHLKNKFSQGFTLIVKMKAEDDALTVSTMKIKEYINSNFKNPKIVEEHLGLLTYYLPDTDTAWSHMFGIMERAKQDLSVEEYSIGQTTLEQIFLHFTKYQRENK